MSFRTLKFPLPVVLFCTGLIPYLLLAILGYFELLERYGGNGTFSLFTLTLIFPPLCFSGGLISAFRLTGQRRTVGLILNGVGLTVHLFLAVSFLRGIYVSLCCQEY